MNNAKPQPYGRPKRQKPSTHVMTVLHPDALAAVTAVMTKHQLSRSGAIHHLVRIGAGLPPLN